MPEDRRRGGASKLRAENLLAWILVGVLAGMVIGGTTGNIGITTAIAIGVSAVISAFVDLPALLRRSNHE